MTSVDWRGPSSEEEEDQFSPSFRIEKGFRCSTDDSECNKDEEKFGLPKCVHIQTVEELAKLLYRSEHMFRQRVWNEMSHMSYWIPFLFTLTGLTYKPQGNM